MNGYYESRFNNYNNNDIRILISYVFKTDLDANVLVRFGPKVALFRTTPLALPLGPAAAAAHKQRRCCYR